MSTPTICRTCGSKIAAPRYLFNNEHVCAACMQNLIADSSERRRQDENDLTPLVPKLLEPLRHEQEPAFSTLLLLGCLIALPIIALLILLFGLIKQAGAW